ncbi:MAG: flagellar assembly protein FliH [Rhodoferax sp.]|uniref:FliH/SctL family protein n=1 Tax=Rhodoferax sp. TaxID=50421 RepID=UPI002720C797|nr:flagellar assembly protein FliH [Rhodoferax sp.]MDO8450754.1 flagellar assembly protein FliH [Rhodoferax sp.]
MRNYTRFIPGEEIGAVEQWSFGAVDTAAQLMAAQVKAREEASDQVTNDAVRQEGYAEGFVQGHAQATLEAQRQITDFIANQGQETARSFAQLFVSVQAQQSDAEQVVARGVLELACELARQVVRRELSVNPHALQPVIREALGLLMAESKTALIRMNPVDIEVLEDVLRSEFSGLSLTLLADATVARGGCLIESAGTVVDGTIEKRWMRAVANLGLNPPWEESVVEQ